MCINVYAYICTMRATYSLAFCIYTYKESKHICMYKIVGICACKLLYSIWCICHERKMCTLFTICAYILSLTMQFLCDDKDDVNYY